MPRKVLALKITPQTYEIYTNYPGTEHFDLQTVNNMFLVRDELLPEGLGYFSKLDFDKFYKALQNPMYFTRFTECMRLPTPLSELPETLYPKKVRE